MINKSLGQAIRGIRCQQGMTQFELSKRADITTGYIRKVERSYVTNVGIETLEKIASALGVSTVEILSQTDFSQSEANDAA